MKIAGKTPGLATCEHSLIRPGGNVFPLTLSATPLGWPERNESEVPDPNPPVEFARDGRGAVLRDAAGQAVTRQKTDDPAWRRALAHAQFLRGVHTVVHALRNDATVAFANVREHFPSTPQWLEAVAAEMADAGITDAEIVAIIDKVRDLNAGRAARVEARAEDFLPETPSDRDGSRPNAPDGPSDISSTGSPSDSEPEEKTRSHGSPKRST